MPTYSTPGVYYHRTDAGVPRVAPLRTDITGFVGMSRRGPLHQALPIESWRQFVAHFGDFTGAAYLAYAVRAFFENGGVRCWIVRVASEAAASASSTLPASLLPVSPLTPPYAAWQVAASSPGVWGNDLTFELRATHLAQTVADPTLSAPDYAVVKSVAGFIAGTHVRIATDATSPAFRAVAAVDAGKKRLYWINPHPEARTNYEKQLTGYDLNRPLVIESVEYTLLVRELGRVIAVYQALSLVPDHPRYGPRVLPPIAEAPVDAIGWHVPAAPDPVALIEKRSPSQLLQLAPLQVPDTAIALADGADGLALLTVRDFIGEALDVFDDELARRAKMRGLRALDPISEVALVAVPDIHIQPVLPPPKAPPVVCVPDPCMLLQPPASPALPRTRSHGDLPPIFNDEAVYAVQSAAIDHCQRHRDRVALLDPPYTAVRDTRLGIDPIRAWRKRFDTTFAALYAPWVAAPDPLLINGELTRLVPPSGHVAGFVAQTDLQIGVHKAPANGSLSWAQRLSLTLDDAAHGLMNEEHINALRAFPGRGLRVFGARTLSSDPSWRYINVRRLMLMIEKAIDVSCQWAVFEPNDRYTRAKVHLSLTSFLLSLWERGALAGGSVKEAFFVNCNEDTSPPAARDRGQLIAEVGVAPSTPFEFVVLRVGYGEDAFEISEVALEGTV